MEINVTKPKPLLILNVKNIKFSIILNNNYYYCYYYSCQPISAIEKKDSKCTVSVERFTLILHFVRENLMKWSRIIINIREYDLHERRNQFCLSNVAKCNLGKVKLKVMLVSSFTQLY